jgi:hypothetical protein
MLAGAGPGRSRSGRAYAEASLARYCAGMSRKAREAPPVRTLVGIRGSLATVLALVALAPVACGGGGDSDQGGETTSAAPSKSEAKAQSVAQSFFDDYANKDFKGACDLSSTGSTCERSLATLAQSLPFKSPKVSNVELSGDTGTAQVESGGTTYAVRLVRVKGDWMVLEFGPATQ